MSQTSTLPAVKAQMVTKITTALATARTDGGPLQVSYAYPGSKTEPETVFLGRHPDDPRNETLSQQSLVGINPGRRQRDEEYDVPVTVWTFRPDLTPADAATAEARAFTIAALIEQILANDLTAGLSQVISINTASVSSVMKPEGGGWKCELVLTLHVKTRLT